MRSEEEQLLYDMLLSAITRGTGGMHIDQQNVFQGHDVPASRFAWREFSRAGVMSLVFQHYPEPCALHLS